MTRTIVTFLATALFLSITLPAAAKVEGKEVTYRDGDLVMKGYLAWDGAIKGKRPGVLVVHEWWGHNEYARKRATMLAELGYTALAVDMYGGGKQAAHPADAGKMAGEVMANLPAMLSRFEAARLFLAAQPSVDSTRLAAIGYCFGGGVVLNEARQGAELRGVASFHGSLTAAQPAKAGAIKARILVFQGGADKFSPPEMVGAFVTELTAAGADLQLHIYPGVQHSFSNPDADTLASRFGIPLAYNADADHRSWQQLVLFLKDIFSK
ncbi:MAG TPA: dienelactone hydrolase family protein [Geobacterales bacterium]|nr:dienelactone hydrolase family protein [Geobacterales bacterium]